MIKAKIKTTGQRVLIRPYSHEFYDFVSCNEDGSIQGTLLRRDELEIIGDNQEDPPAVIMIYWIARSKNGTLWLLDGKPEKGERGLIFEGQSFKLASHLYPEVTFENSPIKVELKLVK